MATETELKLQLTAAELRRLRRHPLVQALKRGRPATRAMKSVYFDTPDHQLKDQQVLLRVRHVGRHRIQAVKTAGQCHSGAWARDEWEAEIHGDDPQLAPLGDTAVADLFQQEGLFQCLQPVFSTEVRRTTYQLADGDWQAELAIDEGQVVAAQGSRPISEAEIELKHGAASRLFDLALQLHQDLPARLLTVSKAERGYALIEGSRSQPEKAPPLLLADDATTADAFREIARACIGQLLINQNCLAETGHPEAIHQMRVALRRLRSAVSVFKDVLASAETESLKQELRWLQDELSGARDAEVFVEEILDPVAELLAADAGYQGLRAAFVAERDGARAHAAAAMAQPRFTRIVLRLGSWVEGGDWLNPADELHRGLLERPARLLAEATLGRRDRKLRKGMRHYAKLSPEQRHKLRIQVKKIRYSAEFFWSLYHHKKAKRTSSGLATLQDRMGWLNDIAVSRKRLRAKAEAQGSAEWLWTAGLISGWHEARSDGVLAGVKEAWRAYEKLGRFWED